jgi:hypothetical protein
MNGYTVVLGLQVHNPTRPHPKMGDRDKPRLVSSDNLLPSVSLCGRVCPVAGTTLKQEETPEPDQRTLEILESLRILA